MSIVRGAVSVAIGISLVLLLIWGWGQFRSFQHEQGVQQSTSCPQVPQPLYNNGTDCP
jgi:hypothetical protein